MKDFTTALREDRNFIMATASKACGRFIDEHDDEWSIALSAYYEAYRNYKEEKGDFHALAATVIRRRLIDSFRANARGPAMVSPRNPRRRNLRRGRKQSLTRSRTPSQGKHLPFRNDKGRKLQMERGSTYPDGGAYTESSQ